MGKKYIYIPTTAVAFAQATFAGLDWGSTAGVAGCITWPAPLLSSYPAGDGALCPLWPEWPAILTVFSWSKQQFFYFYFLLNTKHFHTIKQNVSVTKTPVYVTVYQMTSSEEPAEAVLSVNKYVVYSHRQTGCRGPVLLKFNVNGTLFLWHIAPLFSFKKHLSKRVCICWGSSEYLRMHTGQHSPSIKEGLAQATGGHVIWWHTILDSCDQWFF